ncbi:hypothetical protein D3C73_1658440 [compost metagenome]
MQPGGSVHCFKTGGQITFDPAEEGSEPARRIIGSGNRNPEDEAEAGKHDGEAPYF